MQESDLPAEVPPLLDSKKPHRDARSLQGWLDGRMALTSDGEMDKLSRLKIQSRGFSARGRVRRTFDGARLVVGTAMLNLGPLELQAGGIGMNAGFGLLIQRPGRSSGLAAGQSFRGFSNQVVGWATLPERKSVWGLAAKLKGRGWSLAAMHGRSGDGKSKTPMSALHLTREMGPLLLGVGVMHLPRQRGATISGVWQKGPTNLGFEWVAWENSGAGGIHVAWLVSLNRRLPLGIGLQARWAASSSTDGPFTGGRPAVLNTWGGSGWAVRLRGQLTDHWRLQMLWCESGGPDWAGLHRRRRKRFADFLLLGRFPLGWECKVRWHERIRISEGWSEVYPWMPPFVIGEDERAGLALSLKREQAQGTWFATVRSLGRQGAVTNGRRTLAGIRCRGRVSTVVSLLFSYQWAWGAPVDLVSAVNPLRGLVLPRHWGYWSSEFMVGAELATRLGRIMATFSRREPAVGSVDQAEDRLWVGFQARWE